MKTRVCAMCGKEKIINLFKKGNPLHQDGRDNHCTTCDRLYYYMPKRYYSVKLERAVQKNLRDSSAIYEEVSGDELPEIEYN